MSNFKASKWSMTQKTFAWVFAAAAVLLCGWVFFDHFTGVTSLVNSYGPMSPLNQTMSDWAKTSAGGQASLALLNVFYTTCFGAAAISLVELRKAS